MSRLLVIGGGITGLAAAWQGVLDGAEVTVLEGTERWGGKVQTERVGELLIERGPDSFVSYRPSVMKLIGEVGLADAIIPSGGGRKVALHSRGQLRPIPDGMGMVLPTKLWPFVTTTVLSWPDKFRAALDLIMPRQLPDHDAAIGYLIRKRLGSGIVARFADPMVGGIYGATVDELSIDAVLPSLRQNEKDYRSLIVASLLTGRKARKASKGKPKASPFKTLRGGLSTLIDALVEQLAAQGADLRLGAQVAEVREGVVVLVSGEEIPADAVIFAGGVTSSKELLAQPVPAAAEALDTIPLATSNIVTMAWPVSSFASTPDMQGWLEAEKAPISGTTFSSIKFAGRAPSDTVLVRAFVPEKVGQTAFLPDDELIATILDYVRPIMGATGEPSHVDVSRWNHVMPKYIVGHLDTVATVEQSVAKAQPSWRIAGSALHGVGIPDCIDDGRKQASAALAAL